MFDRVWSCLIRFEGHQTFDQKRKTFLLFAYLMGDVLSRMDSRVSNMFDAGMRTRLHSGLYQLFHLCLIKHVLTVWSPTSTFSMFGHQTYIVCQGPNYNWEDISNTPTWQCFIGYLNTSSKILCCASYFQLSSRWFDISMTHCLSYFIFYLRLS